MARPKGSKNKSKTNIIPMGKPHRVNPKNPVKVRGAAEPAMSNDEEKARIECIRAYRETLRPLQAKLATVKTQIAKVYAQAKGDKFPKKLFDTCDKLAGTRKQEQQVLGDIKIVRLAALVLDLPIAKQLDFFVEAADDAGSTRPSPESEGREQYASGKAMKPPYSPGTKDYDEFTKGFYAAQEDATRNGIKPLKPVKGDKAKAAAPEPDDDGDGETDMNPPWPDDDDGDPSRPLN